MTKTRAGVSALGTAFVLGALLILAPGLASAQQYPPGNPPTSQPPAQPCANPNADGECREPGRTGAGNDAPRLTASPRSGAPGTVVTLSVVEGFQPGTAVTCSIVRMTTYSEPDELGSDTVDGDGGFELDVTIPDTPDGVYVLYCEGTGAGTDDPLVSTTSFVVRTPGGPSPAAAARTNGSTGAGGSTAADLPKTWSAPAAGWASSPAVEQAVTEAVNFRLAALKTELPDVAAAPAAAAGTTSSDDDLTAWYAGGAALALIAAAAVGLRRRAITTGRSGEVQA